MKIVTYGTRGSLPISNRNAVEYGGNTTSLRVHSQCLPPGVALVVDTGSGYKPLSDQLLKERIFNVWMLFTHWHHDHTQGLPIAAHTFIPDARMLVWGPKEHGYGPNEVFSDLMKAPLFPVDFPMLRHRFKCHPLEHIGTQVLVIHPAGGSSLLANHVYQQLLIEGKQMPFGTKRFPTEECLIVKMFKTSHPEYTVSFRFEENPTGKVFVFLTDHENTVSLPRDLLSHLQGAGLLIQDCQYSRSKYEASGAGFGHGTPDYCVETAMAAGIPCLGLTHHDPNASDSDVEQRLAEAVAHAKDHQIEDMHIFACKDYGEYEVC